MLLITKDWMRFSSPLLVRSDNSHYLIYLLSLLHCWLCFLVLKEINYMSSINPLRFKTINFCAQKLLTYIWIGGGWIY